MTFNKSVPLSYWRSYIVVFLKIIDRRFPQFDIGTYTGHDPSRADAADFMVPGYKTTAGRRLAAELADFVWKYRKFFGIWYQIYWGRIRSMTYESQGWRPYFAAGSSDDSKNHHNHVHVSWYEDKNKSSGKGPDDVKSPTAPKPVTPPKPYTPGWIPDTDAYDRWTFFLDRQQTGTKESDSIWILQRALKANKVYDGPLDGSYSGAVQDAVKAMQRKWGDKVVDGVLGPLGAAKIFGEHVIVERDSN